MNTLYQHCRFVMVRPSHAGNVGAAARALKTMGFQQLVLVQPRHPEVLQHPDAIALASGAVDVLHQALIVDSLSQALAPCSLSFALTARHRDLAPPVCDLRQACHTAHQHLQQHHQHQIAFVFGTERTGLETEEVDLCHWLCHINANPEYSSLNVAQAIQLCTWEMNLALQHNIPSQNQQQYATQAQVEQFLAHWQTALTHIDFLNPKHPKKLMPRMRHLFSRIQLTPEEVMLLRGVCSQILKR